MSNKSSLLQEIGRFGKLFSKQQTFAWQRVPSLYREPGVLSGYRQEGKLWTYYFLSIFQVHNETINIWTHLLAAVFYVSKLLAIIGDVAIKPEVQAVFVVFGVCVTTVVLVSAFAHTFHSKSPRLHYVCFQCDYAAIGLFGIGKSILFLHTSCPPDVYTMIKDVALPLNIIFAWFVMLGGCMAKLLYRRPYPIQRKFVQLGSGSFHTVFGGLPVLSRYFNCFFNSTCSLSSLNHLTYYLIAFALSIFFFSSHLPEKRFPGHFDIIGQGHQIFHVFITIATYLQFDAAYQDVINCDPEKWRVNGLDPVDSGIAIAIYCVGVIVIILSVGRKVGKRIEEDLKRE